MKTHPRCPGPGESSGLVSNLHAAHAPLAATVTDRSDADGDPLLPPAAPRVAADHDELWHLLQNGPAALYSLGVSEHGIVARRLTDNVETLLGFSSTELVAREWWVSDVHPDDRAIAATGLAVALAEGTSRVEYRMRHRDGTWRCIGDHKRLARGGDDRALRILGALTDITERRGDLQRRIDEPSFTRIFQQSPAALLHVDADLRVLSISDRCCEVLGWPRESALGLCLFDLGLPDDVAEWTALLGRLRQHGGVRDFECRFRRRTGGTGVALVSIGPFEHGPAREHLAKITDITRYKDLESHAYRAQRVESIGRLAGGIAHDLNNILAPIMMAGPLLRMAPSADELEKLAATIEQSARRGADLVKQLLLFSRGSDGPRASVRVDALVLETETLIAKTFPKSITIETRVPEPPWPVLANQTQLHQVLLNLCVNARDAMPGGGSLRIDVHNLRLDSPPCDATGEARPGAYVRVEVADTGCGIPPQYLEQIFDPFFTTKEPGKGTGLGLSTVIAIVKGHGGFVTVASAVGRGSTFAVYLPAVGVEPDEQPAGSSTTALRGNGERILLVDDEESIRNVAQRLLLRHGYRVDVARDGAEAAVVFNQHVFDLLITDFDMPLVDGIALTKVVKATNPNMKVIISTGAQSGMRIRPEELEALGITAVLPKPCLPDELLRGVQRALAPT